VSVFSWLYRLPGRINRSFSTFALATNVEGPGDGGPQLNVAAARVVIGEITSPTGNGERKEQDTDQAVPRSSPDY
jgi:hypothetical protein